MIVLMFSAALAAAPTFDPGAAGKRCAKDPEGAGAAHAELVGLVDEVRFEPASSTSKIYASRLARVKKLSKGYLCSRDDFLNAAIVLLTSGKPKDLDLAFEFAVEAAKEGLDRSHFVATNAFDRSLVAKGMDQKYGTQFGIRNSHPRGCMYPVDEEISDEQRAAWSMPPLATIFADYLAEQGHGGEPPTRQSLRRLNLMCLSEKW